MLKKDSNLKKIIVIGLILCYGFFSPNSLAVYEIGGPDVYEPFTKGIENLAKGFQKRAERKTLQKYNESLTDEQIKNVIIRESIASYHGNCPCPYNLASNGSRCGKRSAYSRAGGYSPICYPEDITKEMIRIYRQKY